MKKLSKMKRLAIVLLFGFSTHSWAQVTYEIMLVAQNSIGCPDTTYGQIIVEDELLFFVPNAFTPDGEEFNEAFQPVLYLGYDSNDFHLTLFNQWGETVFESYNADKGWNGNFGGGGLAEDGVYVWQIDFKETMSDRRHLYTGHVTLLK